MKTHDQKSTYSIFRNTRAGQAGSNQPPVRVQFLLQLIFAGFLGLTAASASAEFSVLSGIFYGSEPVINNLHYGCGIHTDDDSYMVVDRLTVSQSGIYHAVTGLEAGFGVPTWFGIYRGPFDPSAPTTNQIFILDYLFWAEFGSDVTISLEEGIEYSLVASPCRETLDSPDQGVWTLVFSGPGKVNSPATVSPLDSFIEGRFDGTGPSADIGCWDREYRESGPQQVDISGTYYITKPSLYFGMDICIAIYTKPFDPHDPGLNRILQMRAAQFGDYAASVELNAGQDYYFVVAPAGAASVGEYFYLLTPGTDVRIDPVLSGSWYDPDTSGQGFFFDILGQLSLMSVGWFTYDLQRPAADALATIGEPGHRWLTALGNFSGNRATLDLEVTSGGIFNQGGSVDRIVDGSLDIEFFDCNTGQVTYDLGSVGLQGVIPIQRVSNINSYLCEKLMNSPGMPRLLNRNN